MNQSKERKFLEVTKALAGVFSKDRSTKVACTFLDPEDGTELTRGFNGMPRGIDESPAERHERPMKYEFFEHAERNAIYNLARRYLKGSTALSTSVPTVGCVRAVLSVGAHVLVLPESSLQHPNWPLMVALLKEGGVRFHFHVNGSLIETEDMSGRKARKLSQHLAYAQRREAILCKDPQGGSAVFLDPEDYTILAEGYSGMPRGANDNQTDRYMDPMLRSRWVEPALRNAVYNVVRPLLKGSTAVVTATTCVECARAVAAVGTKRLVFEEPDPAFIERWSESIKTAEVMLQELAVSYCSVPRSNN